MKVTLINYTRDAAATLIFTKHTRLQMSADAFDTIRRRVDADPSFAEAELAYMADTIPSSWEFVDYTFLVEGVSRAYTHQQVRTRAASYAQQTMRVLDMGEFDYVYSDRVLADEPSKAIVDEALSAIKFAYKRLTARGLPPEDARGILPTNIATNIVCKFNLRTLSELCASRTGGRTQGEYQKVINAMADAALAVHPWAERFLFPKPRDYFAEIEVWAAKTFEGDLLKKGELLKIVDKMRKERA